VTFMRYFDLHQKTYCSLRQRQTPAQNLRREF
jgi:hypothetical protein